MVFHVLCASSPFITSQLPFVSPSLKVQLRSEGQSVVLEVNGTKALVVGLHSQHAQQDTMGVIRLSLGGILVKDLELFNSVRSHPL